MNSITHKIRPSARLIHTIGSDLIGDSFAALVELVKNSYDADASKVEIKFEYKKIENKNALVITVADDGHGMSYETVINKWLVPATNDKLIRKKSPIKKRVFQGRKGIGRFAASILGQEMTLISIDETGEKSTAIIDWRIFNTDEFLENIEILVEKEMTKENSSTLLEIIALNEANDSKLANWDRESIEKLINELRKLISPFKEFDKYKFEIKLVFKNCPFEEFNNQEFEIETYPIIKYYDYRISGKIDGEGNVNLLFENNINPELKQTENIETKYLIENSAKYCGEIEIDFRVFDREPDAIENLINKGLIDPISEKYMGKNQAKRLLNEVYGVNIYKNHFRVRPYGNGGIDWLDLDKDRIQNPSLRISNNQIIGFITIQVEEESNLEEKSARDGLKENEYYFGLKELAKKALTELETRRFAYRVKSKKSRNKNKSIKGLLTDLFSFNDLTNDIEYRLNQFNVSKENINQITEILKKEEERKSGLLENIEKTIAIYQGQATLGKIINYILHEGRKSIQFFNSESKVLERYLKLYKRTKDDSILNEFDESIEGFRLNSRLIANLFRRINPLAKQKRGNRKNFSVLHVIKDSFNLFNHKLNEINITYEIICEESITIYGWSEDLFTALTNLIENSIYWLELADQKDKSIFIEVHQNSDSIIIDYKDNGPGLSKAEIESDVIFEPGYSKKINGTGLGLAIVGEAIERLNGKLKAKISNGVHFQIDINS